MIGERMSQLIGRTTGVLTAALLCDLVVLVWPGQAAWGQTRTEDQKLKASDAAEKDIFGIATAISGDTVIVGAYRGDGPVTLSGAAYVFDYSDGAWTQRAKLLASDAAGSDQFGWAVAISGDTAVIGAWLGR